MNLKRGESDLKVLISNINPSLNIGEYIYTSVKDIEMIPRSLTIFEFIEKEGHTLILNKNDAIKLGLPFEFVASWITLNVHSALEAVGLTAIFASALAKHNISCNVVAGYYHDHIFVDIKDTEKAMNVLNNIK